jgi:hypothetical protein
MPTYTYRDKASGDEFDVVMPWAALEAYAAEHPGLERVLVPPMVLTEQFEAFISPATGKPITNRAEHRYDLAASGCRVMEPDESPTKGKLRNKAFTAKRGLSVSDEYRDYDKSTKAKEAP